jgi:ABC-type sugar transport system permease subunit
MAVYPTFRVLYLSLTDTTRLTGDLSFVGFRNYLELFRDPIFRKVVGHTLSFSLSSSLGHIVLGLLPWAVSPIVVAMIAQLWAYPLTSPIAMTLQALGWAGEFSPLGRPATAMWSLIVINVWQFTPFFMLMILAGLQTMNPELHEAAQVDGASPLQRLRYLTLPHIRDILLTLSLFDLVTTAAYFDLIWVTTQGGPVRSTEVLATFTYRIGFLSMDWHRAATVGVILLVVCVLLAAGVVAIMERGRE